MYEFREGQSKTVEQRLWLPPLDAELIEYVRHMIGGKLSFCGFNINKMRVQSAPGDRRVIIESDATSKPFVLCTDGHLSFDSRSMMFGEVLEAIRSKIIALAEDHLADTTRNIDDLSEMEILNHAQRCVHMRLHQVKNSRSTERRADMGSLGYRSAARFLMEHKSFAQKLLRSRKVIFLPSIALQEAKKIALRISGKHVPRQFRIDERKKIEIPNPMKTDAKSTNRAVNAATVRIRKLTETHDFVALWSLPSNPWNIYVCVPCLKKFEKSVNTFLEVLIGKTLWPTGSIPPHVRIVSQSEGKYSSERSHQDQDWKAIEDGDEIVIADEAGVQMTLSLIDELHDRLPQNKIVLRPNVDDLETEGIVTVEIHLD